MIYGVTFSLKNECEVMMYIERRITKKLKSFAMQFPVIYLTGPRQSGKSTLLAHVFPEYKMLSLEDIDLRRFATEDPRGFLATQGEYIIIDEAQRAPDLLSYIQTEADKSDKPGRYILSGSQNFLMMKNISQSLAGRVGILKLFPLSLAEKPHLDVESEDLNDWVFRGGYPKLAASDMAPDDYFPSYIMTYLERDIREEIGVMDLNRFRTFVRVCASRAGTPVNFTDIGNQVDADSRTIKSWLSILEESYIAFRLRPWHSNYGKRQTKTPKLYFYDTGLLCSLLGFESSADLDGHPMRGYIFENAVITEYEKARYNEGKEPRHYFWRDSDDKEREVDLVIERPNSIDLIEVKSAQTADARYTKNIIKLAGLADPNNIGKYVVYNGPDGLKISDTEFVNWRRLNQL